MKNKHAYHEFISLGYFILILSFLVLLFGLYMSTSKDPGTHARIPCDALDVWCRTYKHNPPEPMKSHFPIALGLSGIIFVGGSLLYDSYARKRGVAEPLTLAFNAKTSLLLLAIIVLLFTIGYFYKDAFLLYMESILDYSDQ
jgi:hypothetical protein